MNNKFPHLFSPLNLKSMKLKNRIIMGSMHTGLEDNFKDYVRLANYFALRAKGGASIIVTGGYAPHWPGWLTPFSSKLTNTKEAKQHEILTSAVHKEGGYLVLQILHAGRYGYHPFCLAPSSIKSPISPFKPWTVPEIGIKWIINSYIRCASLAQDAGYDGVEIMGSEGYLINQFLVNHTNKRTDKWGGCFANRMRLALEIVKGVRKKVGKDFIIIFRISVMDLIKDGGTWEEVEKLAICLEQNGVSILSTGVGWHEARIPTIAAMVPRGAFQFLGKRLKESVSIPVICSNRINTPEIAEKILEQGCADLVSMARPLLADPEFPIKAQSGRADEINTCIACNQACLDEVFQKKTASCLVNPAACSEEEYKIVRTSKKKNIAVIGAGAAGVSFAIHAAKRGHRVNLFEKEADIGGQLQLAKEIPGKEDFLETLRYFRVQIKKTGVVLHLNSYVSKQMLLQESYDEYVFATGVLPRRPNIEGIDNKNVLLYSELFKNRSLLGNNFAVIGAGGIGFDVSVFLLHKNKPHSISDYHNYWGIDSSFKNRGGLSTKGKKILPSVKVHLLQRKNIKFGRSLGKTTGWIHKRMLHMEQTSMIAGIEYQKITDKGIIYKKEQNTVTLEVDNIIVCAGQVENNSLANDMQQSGVPIHVIGGADRALEVDAKKAIEQGIKLALHI
jgi:2,4-dienoyl-CoA reductase (NADPH2)